MSAPAGHGQVAELQQYLRTAARKRYTSVAAPPFTIFINPHDPLPGFNYAIPDAAAGRVSDGDIDRLRAAFAVHARTPRLEFLDALTPELAPLLERCGFEREAQGRLLAVAAGSFAPAPGVPDLSVVELGPASDLDLVRQLMQVADGAFGVTTEPTVAALEDQRRALGEGVAVLGRLGGTPVAVATLTPPQDGFAEIAGVGTLPAYRRRGIGSALVTACARAAFSRGVRFPFLSTSSEEAGRIYERIGFRFLTTQLFYVAP